MKNIVVFSLVVMLAGCSLGGREPSTVYTIEPQLSITRSNCRGGKTIEIATPTTSPGLDGRRIAVLQDAKLNYYTGVRWAASPQEMVQQVLLESFEKSGAFKSVSTDIDSVDAQYILRTEIRDFHVTSATSPNVKLRLVSKLIGADSRKILATIPVEREITPEEHKTQSIVDAFAKATAEAARDIVTASKKIAGC